MSSARSGSPASATELVVDASALVKAALVEAGFEVYRGRAMIAPSLLWSEATAAIRQLEFRGEITEAEADAAISRILGADVASHASRGLAPEALTLAR